MLGLLSDGTTFVLLLSLVGCSACSKSTAPGETSHPGEGGKSGSGGSGGQAATGGSTSCEGSEEDCSIGPEVLYQHPDSLPRAIEVFQDFLYWTEVRILEGGAQQGRLVRAPSDGSGPIEEVGPWGGLEVNSQAIAVTEQYVLWFDHGTIRRVSRDKGTSLEPIEVGSGDYRLIAQGDFIYFAEATCQTLGRVPLEGGEPHFYSHPEKPPVGSGVLQVDETHVYCGIVNGLYSVPLDGTKTTKIASLTESWEAFGPMVRVDDEIYYSKNDNNLGLPHQAQIAKVPKTGGQSVDLGLVEIGAAVLRWDSARRTIYWTTKSSSALDRVLSYSVDDQKLSVLAEKTPVYGGNTQDADFVYWSSLNAIMRVSKGAED